MSDPGTDVTAALEAHARGDGAAARELLPLVYDRLRALANQYLQGERVGHVLQPTALVHEAYLRLVDVNRIDWRGTTHFFAMAATQMRRVLIDQARAASAAKRGAQRVRVTLDEHTGRADELSLELLALDEALTRLEQSSPRQARVAELRLFSGMQVAEIAQAVGVSERTVKQDWRVARAWLARELRAPRTAAD